MTVAAELRKQIGPATEEEEPRRPSLATRVVDQLAWLGRLVIFGIKTFASIPYAIARHRDEMVRLVADVTFGEIGRAHV